MSEEPRDQPRERADSGVADSLRTAIERTLAATAPAAADTRERAGELVDGISRRGHEARTELGRRGQKAGEEIARLGQEAREAIAKRGEDAGSELRAQLEAMERRLSSIEELLRRSTAGDGPEKPKKGSESKPEAEG